MAQTYRKQSANPSSLIFVREVLQNREQQLIAAGDFKGAMAITEQLNQIDPKNVTSFGAIITKGNSTTKTTLSMRLLRTLPTRLILFRPSTSGGAAAPMKS